MIFKKIQEIFRYSELIKTLVARDLKVRYKGSVLGYAWTWLDPLMEMLVLIFVFDVLRKSGIEHFPVFLLCGLIPWKLFSNSINNSLTSISGNVGLIKRIYYPREIFPLSMVLSNFVNMLLSLSVLIPVILFFGLNVSLKILLLPLVFFFLFLFTYGLSLIFATLNVFIKDTSHIVHFVVRLWFFLTPIFYSVEDKISERLLDIYMIVNPMAVMLTLFRASLMGLNSPKPFHVMAGFIISILTFLVGYAIFKKNEDLMVKRL